MKIRSIEDLDLSGKKVLVRVDFNVPLATGNVADSTRIESAIPTIKHLLDQSAVVILISHLGRPGGKPNPALSLRPVAEALQELLGRDVLFAPDTVGCVANKMVEHASPGEVILLENLRFELGEEQNDPGFSQQLAEMADCYVNDAFGTAHRAHASTVGVTEFLPSAAGQLMLSEINALSKVIDNPQPPLTLILGGAKISDKIGVIQSFFGKATSILIGGGMANTFLLANGNAIGQSLVEPEQTSLAKELIDESAEVGVSLLLPSDVVVSTSLDSGESRTISPGQLNPDEAIFDIGPVTVKRYAATIHTSSTVVWNGPMGVFETPPYDAGTIGIARAVADTDAFTLIGGGDSVAALNRTGLSAVVGHVSTGGGASLEFLEGKQLPGISALEETGS